MGNRKLGTLPNTDKVRFSSGHIRDESQEDTVKRKTGIVDYSGFILTFEPERTKWIAEHIELYEIKESFSSIDIDLEKREIAFLALEKGVEAITHIALYEKMRGNGGSAKTKMRIIELCKFNPCVSLEEIGLTKEHILTPETINRCNHTKWHEVISQLIALRHDQKSEIEHILSLQKPLSFKQWETPRGMILNDERDALGLSLDIAGIERKSILSKIDDKKIETAECIINAIDSIENHEIDMLHLDVQIFASLLNETSPHYAKFSDDRNNSVRVMITDKTKIETVTGVDLIIVDLKHNNYLMLQYKRMDKIDSDGWKYNITASSNIHKQLSDMEKYKSLVEQHTSAGDDLDVWDYRLNENPFYFKFCEGTTRGSTKDTLTPGITIAYDYLYRHFGLPLNAASKINGPIGYFNCKKYLSNTEFVMLMKEGWIGGNSRYSDSIMKLLAYNKSKGRRALVAIIETPKEEPKSARTNAYKTKKST